jgi:hypothetical protein
MAEKKFKTIPSKVTKVTNTSFAGPVSPFKGSSVGRVALQPFMVGDLS